MHVVMQHIDFNEALKSLNEGSEYIESFVEDMKTKEIISREEFEMVKLRQNQGIFCFRYRKKSGGKRKVKQGKGFYNAS